MVNRLTNSLHGLEFPLPSDWSSVSWNWPSPLKILLSFVREVLLLALLPELETRREMMDNFIVCHIDPWSIQTDLYTVARLVFC